MKPNPAEPKRTNPTAPTVLHSCDRDGCCERCCILCLCPLSLDLERRNIDRRQRQVESPTGRSATPWRTLFVSPIAFRDLLRSGQRPHYLCLTNTSLGRSQHLTAPVLVVFRFNPRALLRIDKCREPRVIVGLLGAKNLVFVRRPQHFRERTNNPPHNLRQRQKATTKPKKERSKQEGTTSIYVELHKHIHTHPKQGRKQSETLHWTIEIKR